MRRARANPKPFLARQDYLEEPRAVSCDVEGQSGHSGVQEQVGEGRNE